MTPYKVCSFSFEISEVCGHEPPFGALVSGLSFRLSRRSVVSLVVQLSAATTIWALAATPRDSRLFTEGEQYRVLPACEALPIRSPGISVVMTADMRAVRRLRELAAA
jgi:hypothetical protein